ncbi:hemopexin repeat-containing protein [Endothiovibrio diazotrophicus]
MSKISPDVVFPIPGLEVVGRGIYLRPRHPYALRDVLFEQCDHWTYNSRELGEAFLVPQGYAVNDSPPVPVGQALNQTVIEESWERFDKQMTLDARVAASNSVFSIDVNANQTQQIHSEESAYYALRSSFIPLMALYLPNVADFPDTERLALDTIPDGPFDHDHRRAYELFFEKYGTHYVRRAWVGGKAMLAFIVAKSTAMTKEEINAGIKASFGGVEGQASEGSQTTKERLISNSECRVFGKGGDELKLAALSTLNEENYNAWITTIKENPQVIELEVSGIWTLVNDPHKAEVLQRAYQAATSFEPISAIFNLDRRIYFIRNDKFFCYDLERGTSDKPRLLTSLLPALKKPQFAHFERPDAAFVGWGLRSPTGEDLQRKIILFRRDQCMRVDADSGAIDPGYPKPIIEEWPGVTFDRIDAAINVGPDAVYFFRGEHYIRYNADNGHADEGYPQLTSERWAGLIFDCIDACIYWKNGKVYFFREDQYIRYDMTTYRADPGYPKFVASDYVEDWKFFV